MTKLFTKTILISYFFLLIILFKLGLPTISEEIPLMQKNDYFNFSTIYSSVNNGRLAVTGNLIRYISPSYFEFFFIMNFIILGVIYFGYNILRNKKNNIQILNLFFLTFVLSPSFSNIFLNIRNLEVLFILPLFFLFFIEYKVKHVVFFHYIIYFLLLNYLLYFKETIAFSLILYYLSLFFFRKSLFNKFFLYFGLFFCAIYLLIYLNIFFENNQNSLILNKALTINENYILNRVSIFLRYLFNDFVLLSFLIFFSFKWIILITKKKYLRLNSLFPISFCLGFLFIHIFIGVYGHYLVVLYPILMIILMHNHTFHINQNVILTIVFLNLFFISIPSLIDNINENIYNRINFNNIAVKLIEENTENKKKTITIIEDGSSFFQVYAFNEILKLKNIDNFHIQISNEQCGKELDEIDSRLITANIPKKIYEGYDDKINEKYFKELPFNFIASCEISEIKKSDFIIYLRKGIFSSQTIQKIKNIKNDSRFMLFEFNEGIKINLNLIKNFVKKNFLENLNTKYSSVEFVLLKKND